MKKTMFVGKTEAPGLLIRKRMSRWRDGQRQNEGKGAGMIVAGCEGRPNGDGSHGGGVGWSDLETMAKS
jgi:F420-0:gamma-glutamyl ligase